MTDQNFDRHRSRLKERLVEQIKSFNRKLLVQIINTMFFIVILLPFMLGTTLYLLGTIFSNAATSTHAGSLIAIKDMVWNFVSTSSTFHTIIIIVGIIVIVLLVIHYLKTSVKFTSKELALASYILAKTKENHVANYNSLRKETEFRSFSYPQIDKVVCALNRLGHVFIEEKESIDKRLIIRRSDW